MYTFAASFNAAIAFTLLPILTKYLSPYDYGIVETFVAITGCLGNIIIVGGNTLLTKEYYNFKRKKRNEYIGNILGVICLSALFLFLFLFSFRTFFSNLIKISHTIIILSIIISFTNVITTMLLSLLQIEKEAKKWALLVNLKSVLNIFISLFFIVVLCWKWQGRIAGISISSIFSFFIALIIFKKKNITIIFPVKYGRIILKMGLPLVLAQIGGWINAALDRVMINNLLDVESTGIYSVGYRFGMIIMLISVAFGRAWSPFFYENIPKKNSQINLKIVKVTYIYIVSLFIISICWGWLGKYILYFIVNKNYFEASHFIMLISLAYWVSGVGGMFGGYIIFKGGMLIYSGITCVSAISNIILNYFLLQKIGLIGAAWATFISFGIATGLTIIIGTKYHKMPWREGLNSLMLIK